MGKARVRKILFAGGGTLGPVTPLLALAEEWKRRDKAGLGSGGKTRFVWVGTRNGPEREVVRARKIPFLHLPVARLTRYPSPEWLLLPFNLARALFLAWLIVGREKPDLIATAGGFTGVPLALAGRLRGVPVWVHQQDASALLANRLAAPFASCVTTAWEASADAFFLRRAKPVGNPVRRSVIEGKRDEAHRLFGIDLSKPTVLVFGGGGGAMWINHLMEETGASLTETANVIHVTGKGKLSERLKAFGPRYHAAEFLTGGMTHALAAADVVVARAGMGTLTELAALKKAAVLIPIPGSAQEANARLAKAADAAIVLSQPLTTTGDLKEAVRTLVGNPARRRELGENLARLLPTDIAGELADYLEHVCMRSKNAP